MQARRVAHLQHDVARQRAHALQNALGHARLIARDHDDRHCLAHGAAQAQHDARQHAGVCRRQHGGKDAALMRRTQRQRALVIAARHRADRRLHHADDRRQDHDRQQERRRQDGVALPLKRLAQRAHRRHQHHDTEEAVHHRRDARQQLNRRLDEAIDLCGAEVRQVHRRQQRHRHADEQRQPGHIDAAHDHREDAVDLRARPPRPAQKEPAEADLLHGRHAA